MDAPGASVATDARATCRQAQAWCASKRRPVGQDIAMLEGAVKTLRAAGAARFDLHHHHHQKHAHKITSYKRRFPCARNGSD